MIALPQPLVEIPPASLDTLFDLGLVVLLTCPICGVWVAESPDEYSFAVTVMLRECEIHPYVTIGRRPFVDQLPSHGWEALFEDEEPF